MSFKNTPPSAVSTKLTFPCTECNFEAQSARQLSRHKAVTHTQNALKCVLCPFVTVSNTFFFEFNVNRCFFFVV